MRRLLAVGTAVVLALVGAATALAKPKDGNWKGTTSESFPNTTITGSCPLPVPGPAPVCFQVSSGGSAVLNFEPAFDGTCTKAGSPSITSPIITTDAGRNIPVTNGKFHGHVTNGRLHSGATTLGKSQDQVHGKFTSKTKASGTLTITYQFNNSTLAQQDGVAGYSCTTGKVTWTASFA